MKLLFMMYREGGFVDRNWVKGSGIYYREEIWRFWLVKFNMYYTATPVKLLDPKSTKFSPIIYSSDPVFLTLLTFVRTSKAFWISSRLTQTTFSDSWKGLGRKPRLGGEHG